MSTELTQQQNDLLTAALAVSEPVPFDPTPAPATHVVIDSIVDAHGGTVGNIAENGLTDDLRPTINGHLDGGGQMVIRLWFNGEGPIEIVTAKDGTFSYTPTTDLLANQEYYVVASVLDSGSRQEVMSLPYHFYTTYEGHDDTTVPDPATDVTIVDNVKGGIVGELHNHDVTNDSTPTISGNATAGDIVRIYNHGNLVGSVLVDSHGAWTYTPAALQEGEYSFTVSVQNPNNGAESTSSEAISIVVDLHADAPVITGAYDAVGDQQGLIANGGMTDDQHPTLTGTAEANATVYVYMKGSQGAGHQLGSTVADADGNWSFYDAAGIVSYYKTGTHPFWAVQIDEAGNKSGSSDVYNLRIVASNADVIHPDAATDFQIHDNVGPVTGLITNNTVTDDSTPTVTGHATAGDIVVIYDNNNNNNHPIGSVLVDTNGNWSFTPLIELKDGAHSFTAVVEDPSNKALSSATDAINFTIDTQLIKPVITAAIDDVGVQKDTVLDMGTTDDTTPTLIGTAEPNSILFISVDNFIGNGPIGSVLVDATGHWTFQVPDEYPLKPSSGVNTIYVVSHNAAGNIIDADPFHLHVVAPNHDDTSTPDAATNVVLMDDVAPVTGQIVNNSTTNDANPTMTGQATAGDTVFIYDNASKTPLGSVVVDSNGNWSFESPALADGAHSFTAIVENPNNNNDSAATTAINFTVDTHVDAPVITGAYDAVGTKVGPIANGGKTDDQHPTFKGTAEANAVVILHQRGVNGLDHVIGSTVADSHGNWTFYDAAGIVGARVTGTHPFWAVQIDEAGNKSANSDIYNLNIVGSNQDDTTTPAAAENVILMDDVAPHTGQITNNTTTDDANPTMIGTATAGDTVFIYDNGSKTPLGSVVANSDGNWSFESPTLADGSHSFTAVVENPNNQHDSSATTAINFIVDTHSFVTISGVIDNSGSKTGLVADGGKTDDAAPVLTGTAEANSVVYINSVGVYGEEYHASTTADANGNWTLQQGYANDGWFTYSVYAVDQAGNQSDTATYKVEKVDTNQDDPSTPAAAENVIIMDDVQPGVGQITNGSTTNDANPTILGTATVGDTVIIYDTTSGHQVALGSVVVTDSNGAWSFETPKLADGAHSITTVVENPVNHNDSAATTAVNFNVETYVPSVHGVESFDNPISNADGHVDFASGVSLIPADASQGILTYAMPEGLIYDETGDKYLLLLSDSTRVELHQDNISSVEIGAASLASAVPDVTFYNAAGQVISSDHISVTHEAAISDSGAMDYRYTTTDGETISSFDIGSAYLGHVSWDSADNIPQQSAIVNNGAHNVDLDVDAILQHAQTNLLINDGKAQMAITGEGLVDVDVNGSGRVSLDMQGHSALVNTGHVTTGGVQYDVYSVDSHTELLLNSHLVLDQFS